MLEVRHQEVTEHFNTLFTQITEMSEKLGVEIVKPRVWGRQRNRANYVTESAEEYYRLSAYIPLLDRVIND